ncbi:hypothetical protein AZI87_16205 [Bdellovibrio bacteriovorus]|uniref:Uncharacterized protein n=1 Tax=Bdellovibrio bacteriovorus TaxID=959 RepID=A0A161QEU5_BDEBC|nr:hypothetical protein [Bdellovibrio bacteriovorus]KYG62817.1 hypothetical protein AZI87_16205 [Bdellovibrio bacteriovorus]
MKKHFLFFVLVLVSCSEKKGPQILEWRKGEPAKALQKLNEISLTPSLEIKSLQEVVAIRDQIVQGILVENTYVKHLKNASGQELLVRGSVLLQEDELKHLNLEEFQKKKSSILEQLKAKFPLFRKVTPEKIGIRIAFNRGFYEPLWQIVYSDRKGISWEVCFSRLLEVRSVKRVGSQFHDTVASLFPQGPKKSQMTEVVLQGLKTQPALSNSRLFVRSQAAAKIDSIAEPLKFSPQDTRFDQVQVFYYLEESLKWFENQLGIKIPFQIQAEVHVGAPEKTNAAFYYSGKIRLGAGDDEFYSRIPQDPSIVIHESVHALVEAVARLPYEGEGGSLNEAFADYFTALQLNNPKMGEVSYLKGAFRRSIVNDLKLADKNGGLYHDSGIASGTLWALTIRFGPSRGRQLALLTLNRLVPSSDFMDFGARLKEVVPMVLLSDEDRQIARDILAERGFQ